MGSPERVVYSAESGWRMNEQTQYELKALTERSVKHLERCQNALQKTLGAQRTLRFLSIPDRHRLLTLATWEERYRVPLEWIVERLLRAYQKTKQRKRVAPGFPVKVSTLVSAASEEMLREEIKKVYPDNVHIDIWRQAEQARLLYKFYPEEEERLRTTLSFGRLSQYAEYYGEQMEKRRRAFLRARSKLAKSLPYRGSPWHT
jgi:hypothetical protein